MRLNNLAESSVSQYLDPQFILTVLPSRYHRGFLKAYNWQPKINTSGMKASHAVDLLLADKKPVVYGLKNSELARIAADTGLQYQWDCVFKQENVDIAEVIAFAKTKMDIRSPYRHYIIGISLGYPLDEVKDFAARYIEPNDSLAAGLDRHDSGDVIR